MKIISRSKISLVSSLELDILAVCAVTFYYWNKCDSALRFNGIFLEFAFIEHYVLWCWSWWVGWISGVWTSSKWP